MPFGCPGHEFYGPKGLSGCGIDTQHAQLGATFEVAFVVFNEGRPALHSEVTRRLRVVSPCPAQVFCPSLTPQCGSTSCAARGALVAATGGALDSGLSTDEVRFCICVRGSHTARVPHLQASALHRRSSISGQACD